MTQLPTDVEPDGAPAAWVSWRCRTCGTDNRYVPLCLSCSAPRPVEGPAATRDRARVRTIGRSPSAVALVLAVALVALAAGGAVTLLRPRPGTGGAATADPAGAAPPEPAVPVAAPAPLAWDPAVTHLVAFVERERGLTFLHPVEVQLLTPEAYTAAATADTEGGHGSETEADDLDVLARELRALGLAHGDLDLGPVVDTLADDATLAHYDIGAGVIRVRGTEITPGVDATLVHELTHALQDQHFDLGRMLDTATDGAAVAFRALVEGDAGRIEGRYVAQLGDDGRGHDAGGSPGGAAAADLDGVPAALLTMFAAPYQLGAQLVAVLEAIDGHGSINDALRTPPTTEEQLLDPFRYLDGDVADHVRPPDVPDGARTIGDGDFGALTLYLVLSGRLEIPQALGAVDGWGGDAYVTYEHRGTTCLAVAVAGDTVADLDELAGAFDAWAGAPGAATGSVERASATVVLRSCDPGGAAADVPPRTEPGMAMAVPAVRTAAVLAMAEAGVSRDVARCVADEVVFGSPPEHLLSDDPAIAAGIQRRMPGYVADCRTA